MADENVPDAYQAMLAKERELDAAVTKKALEMNEAVEQLPTPEARRFHLAAMAKSIGHLLVFLNVDPQAVSELIRRGMVEGEGLFLKKLSERHGKGN